jgi:hypothetical protein
MSTESLLLALYAIYVSILLVRERYKTEKLQKIVDKLEDYI